MQEPSRQEMSELQSELQKPLPRYDAPDRIFFYTVFVLTVMIFLVVEANVFEFFFKYGTHLDIEEKILLFSYPPLPWLFFLGIHRGVKKVVSAKATEPLLLRSVSTPVLILLLFVFMTINVMFDLFKTVVR